MEKEISQLEFLVKLNSLSNQAHQLRDKLIVVSGGVLTVFISINGNSVAPASIKLGFAFLGFSLITGIISILFNLLDSSIKTALAFYKDIFSLSKDIDSHKADCASFNEKIQNNPYLSDPDKKDLLSEHENVLHHQDKKVVSEKMDKILSEVNSPGSLKVRQYLESVTKVGVVGIFQVLFGMLQIILFLSGIIILTKSLF